MLKRQLIIAAVLCGGVFSTHSVRAEFFTLYDGTQQAKTPDQFVPQWLAFGGTGGSQSYDSAKQATLLSTTESNQKGYSNYGILGLVNSSFPTLDRAIGYSVGFRVRIDSETHSGNNDRAGFSVIAISSDVANGVKSSIEIGFQDGRVFSQNDDPLFQGYGEQTNYDPVTESFIDFELAIQGSSYELFADGGSILTGSLRDYTAFSGFPDPYETKNYLFFGDDTTSAGAQVYLQKLTVQTVPEPSSLAIMGAGAVFLFVLRRRFGKSRTDC